MNSTVHQFGDTVKRFRMGLKMRSERVETSGKTVGNTKFRIERVQCAIHDGSPEVIK